MFQSTGPLRDPTGRNRSVQRDGRISIHRSLAGPDFGADINHPLEKDFNPQVPCGTRPGYPTASRISSRISIHRSLAGPDIQFPVVDWLIPISIHRSLAGHFNPQVPCGTRRTCHRSMDGYRRFQSTGPLRDPTGVRETVEEKQRISIHRSLAGPDVLREMEGLMKDGFQSTGPLRDPTQSPKTIMGWKSFQSTGPLRDPTNLP